MQNTKITESARRLTVTSTHLHVLVFVLQVHEPMVRSDSFTELAQIYTHSDEVLPDLPSLIITLECFLKSAERLLPATHKRITPVFITDTTRSALLLDVVWISVNKKYSFVASLQQRTIAKYCKRGLPEYFSSIPQPSELPG